MEQIQVFRRQNVSYKVSDVGKTGIRFELQSGSIYNLYEHVLGQLSRLYSAQKLRFRQPQTPAFREFPFNQTKLEPLEIVIEDRPDISVGNVKMSYFAGGRNARPRRGIDYAASNLFAYVGSKTTYEAITIFFDTIHSAAIIPQMEETRGRMSNKEKQHVRSSDIHLRESEKFNFLNLLKAYVN